MATGEITYKLSGTIRHQGLPVAGVSVVLLENPYGSPGLIPESILPQETGPRGQFTFAVTAGIYSLEIMPDDSTRFVRQQINDIEVSGNTICDVTLETGWILTGSVRTAGGVILKNCEVQAHNIESLRSRVFYGINHAGKFTLIVPKGRYYVIPRWDSRRRRVVEAQNSMAFVAPFFQVIDISGDQHYDMVLPDLSQYKGFVVDPSGKAVPGAKVSIGPSRAEVDPLLDAISTGIYLETDDSGCFQVNVQNGRYDIRLTPPKDAPLSELDRKAHMLGQEPVERFELAQGVRLSGKVTLQGENCPYISIHASSSERKLDFVHLTDREGNFSFGLPAGYYELTVDPTCWDARGSRCKPAAPGWRSVIVTGDTYVDVELGQAYPVSGAVRDLKGKPRSGVTVAACPDRGKNPEIEDQELPLTEAETGDAGCFSLQLSPGSYWLFIAHDLATAQQIEVKDKPVSADFVWHGGFRIRFEVVSEDDHPVSRCKVSWSPYGKTECEPSAERTSWRVLAVSGSEFTGDDGVFERLLPPGLYSFQFEPMAHGRYLTKNIRQLSVAGDTTRRVKLSPRHQDNSGQLTLDFTPPAEHE